MESRLVLNYVLEELKEFIALCKRMICSFRFSPTLLLLDGAEVGLGRLIRICLNSVDSIRALINLCIRGNIAEIWNSR